MVNLVNYVNRRLALALAYGRGEPYDDGYATRIQNSVTSMEGGSGRPIGPAGETPPRRPNSIRRTSSIDTSWPGGQGGPSRFHGVARDMTTLSDGSPEPAPTLDVIKGAASPARELLALESWPSRPGIAAMVGQRAGRNLRAALDAALPEERDLGSPLYLLLDDLAGATLVAPWAWSQWPQDGAEPAKRSGLISTAGRNGRMEGVCIGFAPGSSALAPDGGPGSTGASVQVPSLVRADDPEGWHPLADQDGVGMRRARRIDVWRDGDLIHIDAAFQDSASTPGGRRAGLHEYGLRAMAAASGTLLSLEAVPRILPYRECPSAAANLPRLIGAPLATLRSKVLDELRGTAGCTHLNDMLRALAEVPQLASRLA